MGSVGEKMRPRRWEDNMPGLILQIGCRSKSSAGKEVFETYLMMMRCRTTLFRKATVLPSGKGVVHVLPGGESAVD
jgi:hypothetical protein